MQTHTRYLILGIVLGMCVPACAGLISSAALETDRSNLTRMLDMHDALVASRKQVEECATDLYSCAVLLEACHGVDGSNPPKKDYEP